MILVTGGTGLVGAHLLLNLIGSGEKVVAIHRRSSDFSGVKKVFSYYRSAEEAAILFQKIEWIEADIIDIPALEEAFYGISQVFHAAALVSFDQKKQKLLRKINIEGTANIVNLCIANNIEKLCYVSSIATFDKKLTEDHITELSGWNKEIDHSFYAITKYGAEMEVWRAGQEGIPVVIVNPGVIIGPGFWNSGSGLMFKKIYNNLKFHFPKTTGFVGVEDVVQCMLELMNSDIKNEQFILVSENLSFEGIFRNVADSLGKPSPKIQIRPWMAWLLWAVSKPFPSGPEVKMTRLTAKGLFTHSFYSSEKIESFTGFTFRKMDEVITDTGEKFLEDQKDKTQAP